MAEHAEVFISGTTRDLGSYRREIKEALLTLKIFPIGESNFELTYGRACRNVTRSHRPVRRRNPPCRLLLRSGTAAASAGPAAAPLHPRSSTT
jgi:hypothetical protein